MCKELEDAVYKMMNEHAGTIAKNLSNMYDKMKECPKCNGDGFVNVEDVEIQALKECPICKGEGVVKQ